MDENLAHAHGTVMTLAWMVFGSTGILFARYGRVLRLGNQRQLLGKSVWFQTHRFLLSVSSLLTLVGFFLIIMYRHGQWVSVDMNGKSVFLHSIIGSIVLCCVIFQIWLALYRCHPNSHFRFIFSWSHRIIGCFSSILSFLNLFVITSQLTDQYILILILISLWLGWMIIIIIIFEIIQYQYRKAAALMALNARVSNGNPDVANRNIQLDTEAGTNPTVDNQRLNKIKFILFVIHFIVSLVFSIPFIVLLWNQD